MMDIDQHEAMRAAGGSFKVKQVEGDVGGEWNSDSLGPSSKSWTRATRRRPRGEDEGLVKSSSRRVPSSCLGIAWGMGVAYGGGRLSLHAHKENRVQLAASQQCNEKLLAAQKFLISSAPAVRDTYESSGQKRGMSSTVRMTPSQCGGRHESLPMPLWPRSTRFT